MKKEKEFFKNYSDDVKLSRSVEEIKKHIDFAEPRQKTNTITRKWLDTKLVVVIAIMIFVLMPVSFVLGYIVSNRQMIPIDNGNNDSSEIQTYLSQHFDNYLENSLYSVVRNENLEIAFYIARDNQQNYLVVYVKSFVEQSINIAQNGNQMLALNTFLLSVGMFEIEESEIEIDITVVKNGQVEDIRNDIFELESYLNLLTIKEQEQSSN